MNTITPINGQIVLVGVCTHRRPQMLRDCLDSLTQQLIPSNISAAIVVVDNEPVPAAGTIVDEFVNISPIPLYYVHEPRRGIACARNAVLDTATSMCADWIAFIDDDEIAEQDWLANLSNPPPEIFGQSQSARNRNARGQFVMQPPHAMLDFLLKSSRLAFVSMKRLVWAAAKMLISSPAPPLWVLKSSIQTMHLRTSVVIRSVKLFSPRCTGKYALAQIAAGKRKKSAGPARLYVHFSDRSLFPLSDFSK